MKRLILLILVSLFYSSFAWAETFTTRQTPDDGDTVTVDSGDTYYFNNSQTFEIENHSNVTLTNNGNIMAHNQPASPTEMTGQAGNYAVDASGSSSSNFTLTNNGTIWAGEQTVIDLRDATGTITVTNNAGATIASGERMGSSHDHGLLDLTGAGSSGDTITITNHGTIQNVDKNFAIIDLDSMTSGAIVNFTNTGTITQGAGTMGSKSGARMTVDAQSSTDEINFTNSGTMQANKQVFILGGSTNFTLTNSGTIREDEYAYQNVDDDDAESDHSSTTIEVLSLIHI